MPLPCSQNGAFKAKDGLNPPTGRFVSLSPGWANEKGSPGQSILLPGKVGCSAQSIGITLPPLPPSSSSPTAPRLKIYTNTNRAPLHPPPHPASPPSCRSLPIYATKVSSMAALAPLHAVPRGAGSTVTSLLSWHQGNSPAGTRCGFPSCLPAWASPVPVPPALGAGAEGERCLP